MQQRHGGQILVDQLKVQGVNRVYCVPGESYLAALDGLYESGIDVVVGRQEGGVAMMAAAEGKVSGQPGIAFVTRGPGATNASAGVHVAYQNSNPMILFIGQVGRSMVDREAFQEINYRHMFGDVAKWVAQIDQIERIPEYISRAFHVALSGRPGPVVLALPEDVLSASVEVADGKSAHIVRAQASGEDVDLICSRLAGAEKPLVIVGGGGWNAAASDHLQLFAETFDVPVTASFRRQDYMDNRHPNYAGDVGIGINPELAKMIKASDCLLVLGARLGEMPSSGYSLLDIPDPQQPLIHVHVDPDELGRVYRPEIAINAAPSSLLEKLSEAEPGDIRYGAWTRQARQNYEAWTTPEETPGAVKMEQVIAHLRDTLPDDAVLTNGAGNYAAWLHRYYYYRQFGNQVAPTSGSMGYGLPAAIAAKLNNPERLVVCLAGDGCFQMTCQEFGTAVQYGANIVVLVCNNNMYGTIRMHQEKNYPGRVSGTELVNPDFTALAQAYGGYGERVERQEDFAAAFERAKNAGRPALLELVLDRDALSPKLRLSDMG